MLNILLLVTKKFLSSQWFEVKFVPALKRVKTKLLFLINYMLIET